jgi:hypothetical protein
MDTTTPQIEEDIEESVDLDNLPPEDLFSCTGDSPDCSDCSCKIPHEFCSLYDSLEGEFCDTAQKIVKVVKINP